MSELWCIVVITAEREPQKLDQAADEASSSSALEPSAVNYSPLLRAGCTIFREARSPFLFRPKRDDDVPEKVPTAWP